MGLRNFMGILAVLVLLLSTGNARAADPEVQAFTGKGLLVALPAFFKAADTGEENPVPADGVSGLALVTESGVYSFLETPGNAEKLKGMTGDQAVRITGRQFTPGRLIEIRSLEKLEQLPSVDLTKYSADKGRKVSLEGENKCQCGLKIGSLEASCDLGHLHHLEAEDGRMYHYLQTGPAVNMFLGKGYHFKKVKLDGLVFPGQFLLVRSAEVIR